MEKLFKALAVITNAANYAVGIAVAIILIFKTDFISVFYISSMTTNECLFFNLIMFQLGLMLVGILICIMANDYKKNEKVIEFPVFYELIPIAITVISIFYGFRGETSREKLIVIACAVLYSVISAVIVYCGSRIFQILGKE